MPTYDYKCPNGHTFELFQKMSDEAIGICSKCGEAGQRQISGGAGFLFKGEGFYITDHRSKDYKEKAESEAPGGSAKPPTSDPKAGSSDSSASEGSGGSTDSASSSSGSSSSSSSSSSSGSSSSGGSSSQSGNPSK